MTAQDIEQLHGLMQQCFKYDGPYRLSSGRESHYYYDGKGATQDPPAAWLIADAAVDVILESGAEAVGGLELGAVPIADAIGLAAHVNRGVRLPTFIVRKEAKGHGTQSRVSQANQPDGAPLLVPGRRVAVVDDVITTGGSIQQAIDVVRGLGCVVTCVVAVVERHESKDEALRGQGFAVMRIFYTDEAGHLFVDEEFVRRAGEAAQSRLLAR